MQNSLTDRDAVRGLTFVGPRNDALDGVEISTKMGNVGGCPPTEKLWESSLCCGVCSKGIIQSSIATLRCDCMLLPTSHYIVPVKNPPPAMRPFVKIMCQLF